ncbi:Cytochrome c oxidase subunit 5A [Saitozyma podzolica]|uniref:Cytochrome c oxidase subunit 5A n=1 Tax=Saitozyma podzolica TaxID=1890683 RepID=A0A427YHB8_9TREE|nr:Cytochrome c oxidase subunit 5A [Saitozyma podzolica]
MSLIRSLRPLSSSAAFARAQASVRYASVTVTSTRSNESAPILANIEASWKNLPSEEQYEVYQQLEELQKKDWKELTVDEKKAAAGPAHTMTREYQEATTEHMRSQNNNPISGVSSEGYKGKGMVTVKN